MDKIDKIAKKYLTSVFALLVKHVGCDKLMWDDMNSTINLACESFSEYRFQGSLGSGGKLFYCVDIWRVDTYYEEKTKERFDAIKRCNEELASLYELFVAEAMKEL